MNLHNRIYTWYPRSLWLSKGDWSSIHQFGVQQKILKNVLYPKHPHPIPQQYTPTHIQQLRQATTIVTELIEWVSKVAVICLKLCATIADPSSPFPLALPHFCGLLLKGTCFKPCLKMYTMIWKHTIMRELRIAGCNFFMFFSSSMPSSVWKAECFQRLQSSSLFASSHSYQIDNEPINFKCSQIWYYKKPQMMPISFEMLTSSLLSIYQSPS